MTRRAAGDRARPPEDPRGNDGAGAGHRADTPQAQDWSFGPGARALLKEEPQRYGELHLVRYHWMDGTLLPATPGEPATADAVSCQPVAMFGSFRMVHASAVQDPSRPDQPHARARKLVDRIRVWIEAHADDEALSVSALASAMNMSRTSLHRKLVSSVGLPPGEFIRIVRLELARRLLLEGSANVSEIAYAVGFVSLSGFSRAYRSLYGEPPSSSRPRAQAPSGRSRRF